MLIKHTRLTEALAERLTAAGNGRDLDVFQDGADIYVGAPLAPEEEIEVAALVAADAVEPFGDDDGEALRESLPACCEILSPYSGDVATLLYRGPKAVEYVYGITALGNLVDHTDYSADRDATNTGIPSQIEVWLRGHFAALRVPDGYDVDRTFKPEVAALVERRGLTHNCTRFSITKTGCLRILPGENDSMPVEVWEWLTGYWRALKGNP